MESYKETTQVEDRFKSYMNLFELSETDIQKPLLDIGTGKGDFINYLRNECGNTNAYGIELEQFRIPRKIEGVLSADALHIPFKDETFEIIVARHCLPILLNQKNESVEAITEIIRVLKPGGKFIGDICLPKEIEEDITTHFEGDYSAQQAGTLAWLNTRLAEAKVLEDALGKLKAEVAKIYYRKGLHGATILTIDK